MSHPVEVLLRVWFDVNCKDYLKERANIIVI